MLDALKKQSEENILSNYGKHTSYGRPITSSYTAKDTLYFAPEKRNPLEYIGNNIENEYFGMSHKKENLYPIYIPNEAINHILLCGITRSGKGILAGIKSVEYLRQKKGLIYIDVKQEDFTPQIIKEELIRQGRENDLLVVTYPHNFLYSGLHKNDTVLNAHEKVCEALEIGKTSDANADYFRGNERMTIKSILLFMRKEDIPFTWYNIAITINAILNDLENMQMYDKEKQKTKPNFDYLSSLNNIHFSREKLYSLSFKPENIEALKTLYIKFDELISGVQIEDKYSIDEALYNGKVLYIKADMLNLSALKLLKVLFVDIAQRARMKRGANCTVIADEISFYATEILAGMLATMAGFGVRFILQLQDLAQMKDSYIRNSILTNCSVKLFFKISDTSTLDYVKKLGGDELVTQIAKSGKDESFRQTTEPLLNPTMIRAMWYKQNAILIAEYMPTAIFIQCSFIQTNGVFDWEAEFKKAATFERISLPKSCQIEQPEIKNIDRLTDDF